MCVCETKTANKLVRSGTLGKVLQNTPPSTGFSPLSSINLISLPFSFLFHPPLIPHCTKIQLWDLSVVSSGANQNVISCGTALKFFIQQCCKKILLTSG